MTNLPSAGLSSPKAVLVGFGLVVLSLALISGTKAGQKLQSTVTGLFSGLGI